MDRENKKINKKIAIKKLKELADESERLKKLKYDNQEFVSWINRVNELLTFAFDGCDQEKFANLRWLSNPAAVGEKELNNIYQKNILRCKTTILTIIDKYEVSINEEETVENKKKKETPQLPIELFDAIKFHPKIIEVSRNLFKTENYPQAILEAFKAVNNYVKDKTGLTDNGTNLMNSVFNENKPILKVNELLTPSQKDEQKGFKFIFMGGQLGIRNLNAHDYIELKDPNVALEYLGLASLLMRRIDESKLVTLNIKESSS
jgi:uncharacterized protein (TIGR02391 family)